DFALFPLLDVRGLALAHTLGYVVGCVVAGRILLRRVGGLDRRRTLMQVARVSAASLVCAGAMVAVVAVRAAVLSAGQGLALEALGLGRGSRVAMPAYHCGSEVEAAHLAGVEIDFYRVDGQLRVDADDLARAAADADAVYLISHFGFPMADIPADARLVIEDAAHGLFSADPAGRPLGSR